jgi:hypothetical protein
VSGSRRRVAFALILVVLVCAGATAALALHRSDYTERNASWQLRGVSADGRTITIREPDRGACDDVRSRARSSSDRIEVTVKLREPRNGACILSLMPGTDVTFRLATPVAGRRITGPKKKLSPPYRVDQNGRSDRTQTSSDPLPIPSDHVPRVVGLRYGDARDVLCNAGFQARPTTRDRGEVTEQGAPFRQRRTGRARPLTCSNGRLPAVPLTANP